VYIVLTHMFLCAAVEIFNYLQNHFMTFLAFVMPDELNYADIIICSILWFEVYIDS
jgi:hypothetical protein